MTDDEALALRLEDRVEIIAAVSSLAHAPRPRGSVVSPSGLWTPDDDDWKAGAQRNPVMYTGTLRVHVRMDFSGEVHHFYPEHVRKLGLLELLAEAAQ